MRSLALGMGVAAEVHAADLADEGQVRALMASVVARQGVPFAVVNNASLFEYDSVADFSTRPCRATCWPTRQRL